MLPVATTRAIEQGRITKCTSVLLTAPERSCNWLTRRPSGSNTNIVGWHGQVLGDIASWPEYDDGMKVLFISPNAERLFMPTLPLGPALVAAATRRAGHEIRFLDLLAAADPLNEVRQAITEFQPEVIALSVRNVDDQTMLDTKFLLGPVRDVVAACRAARQAKIVVGGAGYSIFPEAALRYLGADLGVCGEGEEQAVSARRRCGRFPSGWRPTASGGWGFCSWAAPARRGSRWTKASPSPESLNLEMLKVSVGIRLYPHTPLARQAVEEGVVSPEDDLLMPRFYIRPGLEDYIRQAQGEI